MAKPISPLNVERYELKYRIPLAMVAEIARYVESYCEMDYYSQISHDGFYIINSLYLDTPRYHIFHRQESVEFDYSCFRIRSYGANPNPPYYFESKQKIGDFCKKRRGKVPIENFGDLIEAPWKVTEFDPYRDRSVVDFMEKAQTFNLEPRVLTQYRRMAFLSAHDDYARVTFDRDLKLYEEHRYNVHPDEARMRNYDHQDTFLDPWSGRNVILELKCERKIPSWLITMIRTFQLTHYRFSKFYGAMIEAFSNPDHQKLQQRTRV